MIGDCVLPLSDFPGVESKLWKDNELARRYVEGALEHLWDQAYSSIGAMHGPQHFDVLAARDILRKCHEEILKDIK
jgi:hypothetical protein